MPSAFQNLRRISLTAWIMIAMVIGVFIGWLWPEVGMALKPLSTIFLRMIKSIIVPIIFGTLVVGIAGHGDDMKRVGRLALKSIIYFEIVTTIALFIGLAAVNLTRPGIGVKIQASPEEGEKLAANTPTGMGFLEHVVPTSFFDAAAKNEVLQIVFFSILFAVALSQVKGRPKEIVLAGCEGLAEVMFKFTGIVMRYAPIGIGAAIAVTVGHSGLGVLINLGKLILTLYAALIVLVLVVFVPVALMFKVPIREFLAAVKEPALIAFSTTSSEAALPRAMQAMEGIGVPRRIVAFVMPTGYSFNLDGSTLYLAVASIFVAQAAGVDLTMNQQLIMMLTLMLTSKGVAAVPRASLVILAGTLHTFGLPLEGIAIILGVDELMDMARTSVNLVGNCLATVVMAKWEGEFGPPQPEVLRELGALPQPGSVHPESPTSGAAPGAF
ncbi:MAG TPA: cation:dicarboxylase symporter family transporter [Gemmatimonadaceae bacterium]|nr:cation:dicarboxylase symporter family transporter [Gemmatimonadaceae bacterium]